MSEHEVPVYVRLAQKAVKPAEILRWLVKQFTEETFLKVRMLSWHKEIVMGHKHVEIESDDRRQSSSITDNYICRIQRLLAGDRRLLDN